MNSDVARTIININGETLHLLVEFAVYWPDHDTLIVSDLHLEKASSFASKTGQYLPPYDTSVTLDKVEALNTKYKPKRIISLGDSFHDIGAFARLNSTDKSRIKALTHATDWVWVEGNHDPVPPPNLGGRGQHTLKLGRLIFRHEPIGEPGEVAGHLHPSARLKTHQGFMRRRCFVFNATNLVLPAMGALTGGLEITHASFANAFHTKFKIGVPTSKGVITLDPARIQAFSTRSRGLLSRKISRQPA